MSVLHKLWFCCFAVTCFVATATAAEGFRRTEDVVYGRKFGTALTLDVFEPPQKNGAAVIWIISGSFISDHAKIRPEPYAPLLARGYTVFTVVHGSRPRFLVPEMIEDIRTAIRFIRHNAARWAIDPQRLGLSGSSAGGFLALSIATRPDAGQPDAADPVARESSEVAAVACFYPPTDLANFSRPGETMWEHVSRPTPHTPATVFGPEGDTRAGQLHLSEVLSPINYVHRGMPPILLYHGDADAMVPVYQSQRFVEKCRAIGASCELVVKPHAGHGGAFGDHLNEVAAFAAWYDRHLRPPTKP